MTLYSRKSRITDLLEDIRGVINAGGSHELLTDRLRLWLGERRLQGSVSTLDCILEVVHDYEKTLPIETPPRPND